MARKSSSPSKRKFEAVEADWYASPEGRRQTQREFDRALRAGTLRFWTGRKIAKTDPKMLQRLMEQAKENTTRAISIRIPIVDLERARRIADRTRVGYQVVLKQAIRQGLKKPI
jgi:hypothetical protein